MTHDAPAATFEPHRFASAAAHCRSGGAGRGFGLVPDLRFRLGSSLDLGPALGRFRLVTMGRSFHWMDRAETPRRLDGLIEPDSGVALFADTHPEAPEHAWRAAWRASLDRYCEPGRPPRGRAGRLDRHHSVPRDAAFPVLTVMRVVERRMISSESLIEHALSMSRTSAGRIGTAASVMVAA